MIARIPIDIQDARGSQLRREPGAGTRNVHVLYADDGVNDVEFENRPRIYGVVPALLLNHFRR